MGFFLILNQEDTVVISSDESIDDPPMKKPRKVFILVIWDSNCKFRPNLKLLLLTNLTNLNSIFSSFFFFRMKNINFEIDNELFGILWLKSIRFHESEAIIDDRKFAGKPCKKYPPHRYFNLVKI